MGKDTHALSGPAQRTALEVLAANGVETIIQRDDGVTPTPVPTGSIQQQIIALDSKIVADNSAAEAALMAGNFTLYGTEEAKLQADLQQLQKLLAQQSPSPAP